MQPSASGPHRVRRRDVLDRHWKGRLLGFKQKNDGMVAIVQHVYTIADLHIRRPPNLHSPFASNYVFPSTLVEEQPIQSLSGTFMAVHAHNSEVMFANVPMKDLVERRIFFYSYNCIVPKTTEAYGKLEPIDPPSLQSPAWPIPDDWSLLSLKRKVVDDLKASPDEDVVLPHMQVGGVVKDAPDVSTQPRSALAESKQLLLEYPTGVEGALAASSSSAHEELIDVQEHEAVADAIPEVEISRFASIVIDDEEFVFLHDIEKACSLRMDECLSLLKLKEEPVDLALEEKESANLDVALFRAKTVVDEPIEDVPVTETSLTLVHLPSFHLNGKDYITLHSIQSLFNIREDYCLAAIAEASQVAKDFVDIEGESNEDFLALDPETSNQKFLEAPNSFEFCLRRVAEEEPALKDVDFKAMLVELGIEKFGRNVIEPDKINVDLGAKINLEHEGQIKADELQKIELLDEDNFLGRAGGSRATSKYTSHALILITCQSLTKMYFVLFFPNF
ncbi:hypothetical protein L7F22_069446 [Adiantum nelumboides]|nr:hypothetical protein [Adiantum nelumboides]